MSKESREWISNSIATMFLSEEMEGTPIDCYNHWVQKTGVTIRDPKVAVWTLSFVESLRTTDRRFLDLVINGRDVD